MKKAFSIGLGLVVGLVLCLLIGHAFKGTGTTTTLASTSSRFGGSGSRRFGSGMYSGANKQFSGMNARGSGHYYGGSGRNGTGNFMRGSGSRQGMGRRSVGTGGTVSPSQLLDQGLATQ